MAKGRGSDICLVCGHRHLGRRCNPRHLRGIDHANQQATDAEDRPDDWPGHPGTHRTYSERLADGEAFARGCCGLMIMIASTCVVLASVSATGGKRTAAVSDRGGGGTGNRAGVVEAAAQPNPTDRPDPAVPTLRILYDAIGQVETSGRPNPPPGDGGRALGPYQIWRVYWTDALEYAPELGGRYEDVSDRRYAEFVMLAYWLRWCPDALERGDWQTLARVHNGGPRGHRKTATLAYWRRVQDAMNR